MPKLVHEQVLMCGYRKCCPTFKKFDDGSIELSDDDAENGSVGTIKIRPESVDRLLELLVAHKKA